MNRKQTLILSAIFHSLAIAIIVFGSIINFHQYKIWGKPLIPQFVGLKHDSDKSTKILPAGHSSVQGVFTQKNHTHSDSFLPVEIARNRYGISMLVSLNLSCKVFSHHQLTSSGLRAPPIV